MKKLIACIMMSFLMCISIPVQVKASGSITTSAVPSCGTEAKDLLKRLDEIQRIDKSKLSSAEKKNLRKEVKTIRHQLKEIGGGVYLSAGAIIVILILLIILT